MKKILFLIFLFFSTLAVYATTTSGNQRNVNTADGIVTTLANAGSNNGAWEKDEVYQGYQGIVNWYLTWDDNNLYLGRKGFTSSNGKPSLIYIRAQYPNDGNNFTNLPLDYDGVQPDASKMGGINFVAYMKSGYDEYRTWNGTGWTNANTALNPVFKNSGGEDHMEITIPWNTITNGNGKPKSIRAAMLQINLNDNRCPGKPYVFSESPWGNGIGGSPTLGVNDGAPTTEKTQPGGCNVEKNSLERWWGCYPVISGVSSNGFVAKAPDAGPDIHICDITSIVTMSANDPSADAIGTWSYVASASTPGVPVPTIAEIHNRNTSVSGLTTNGKYVFAWDINYGGCPSVPDIVLVTRWLSSSQADAGIDDSICFPQASINLNAIIPANGAGRWKTIQGTGIVINPLSNNSAVTGLSIGKNIFKWTVGNGPACDSTSDLVTIIVNTLPNIITNPQSQSICENSNVSYSLTATGANLTYQWQVSLPGGTPGTFQDLPALAPLSGVNTPVLTITNTPISFNGYKFRCIVSGSCSPTDTSADASLIVKGKPVITDQPVGKVVCYGERAVFEVTATGEELKYQWLKNGQYIVGENNDSLVLTSTSFSDSGMYSVTVSGECAPSATSAGVKLTVNELVSVTEEPANIESCPGETIAYTVKARGTGLGFQWQRKGKTGNYVNITNSGFFKIESTSTTSMVSISNISEQLDGNLFRCIVSGVCHPSDTTTPASLKINTLKIIGNPNDTTVCENSTASFRVNANATNISYQWIVSTDGGLSYNVIGDLNGIYKGSNSKFFTLNKSLLSMDKYIFRCIISGACDNVKNLKDTTEAAILTVNKLSDAGTISALQNVICINTEATVNLSGTTGTIQWQKSSDGFVWSDLIGESSNALKTGILSDTTYYRAIATNGTCSANTSQIIRIDITPATKPGTISVEKNDVCINHTTDIKLSGSIGSIQWQQSSDELIWSDISGAASSVYSTPALTDTIFYRAIVKSGVCEKDTSISVKLNVIKASSIGAGITARSPICINDSSEIKITGNIGSLVWQQSDDGVSGWANVTEGTGVSAQTYSTPSLTKDTYYRALATNGVCETDTSFSAKISITPLSVSGVITTVQSPVCINHSTSIKVSGSRGNITWQSSVANDDWKIISGINPNDSIYNTEALKVPTFFRAVVTNGVCASDTGATVKVDITEKSIAGVSAAVESIICYDKTATINLTGTKGNITWQQSENGQTGWIEVNSGSGIHSQNLTTSSLSKDTYYRALVTNGVCETDTSLITKISVTPVSLAGIATSAQSPVCIDHATSIKLSGSRGTIIWQSATANNDWKTIIGTGSNDSTYNTGALKTSTLFRAILTNGVCASDTGSIVKVEITEKSIAGVLASVKSPVCFDNAAQLNLTGKKGAVIWQQSETGTSAWSNITNTKAADSLSYTTLPLKKQTFYRVLVKNGVCETDTTTIVKVDVTPVSIKGITTAVESPICENSAARVNLDNFLGSIQWEQSPNGKDTWSDVSGGIGADSFSYISEPLKSDTYFRAKVKNGVCEMITSDIVKVEVTSTTNAGTASPFTTPICKNQSTLISLKDYNGNIEWEETSDTTTTWKPVSGGPGNTSSAYRTPELSEPVYYRAKVKNGVCAKAYSLPVKVSIYELPTVNLGNDTSLCKGLNNFIEIIATKGFAGYEWNGASGSNSIRIFDPGTFTLKVTDQNGCTASDIIEITDCNKFKIPNVFTPNGDGINDYFVIVGNKPGSKLEVYNRWGSIVFQSVNYNNDWDASNVIDATYYYLYELNGTTSNGWVEIIRGEGAQPKSNN